MEQYRRQPGVGTYRGLAGQRVQSPSTPDPELTKPERTRSGSSLAVGAKTLAGIGIGLITVIGGSAIIGVAAETVLIPSLLVKLAGGIAGGGVGMAKGLKDAKKD